MDGIGRKNIRNALINVIRYGLGAFFLIMSFAVILQHVYFASLLFLLAVIIVIPSMAKELENIFNFKMSGIVQFFIVFLLVAVALAALPITPTATSNNTTNNTETVATPPTNVSVDEAIAVPSEPEQAAISNSTSNPANTSATSPATTTPNVTTKNSTSNTVNKPTPTPAQKAVSTPTPAQKAVSTPASIPAQKLDNKGKLDILTNPAGATVTVDGVSKGVSPIEGLSVESGTHYVTVYLSGYDPQQEKVEVANSETKELGYSLVPTASSTSVPEEKTKPETTSSSTSVPEEKTKPETTSSSTSVSYQDTQWVATCGADMNAITNDIDDLTTAADNYDFTSLSTYSNALYKDSQKAIGDSDLYSVSPDLQRAKDEYRTTMVQANWAAVFTYKAVDELENGNTKDGNADLKEATQYVKSFGEHAVETTKLLDAYNSKIS